MRKDWIDESTFDPIPMPIFRQYDELRMDLAKEVLQVVEDSLVDTHMDSLMKRVKPLDIELLRTIAREGPVRGSLVGEDLKESVIRCKARGLISPQRISDHYYKYDITELGLSLLEQKARITDKTKQMRV